MLATRPLRLACLMLALTLTSTARAQDALKLEVAELAKGLAQAIQDLGEDSVAVGQFSGPPQFPTSGGPAIANALAEELGKLKITVKRVAKLGIKGDYRNVKDQRSGRLAARVEAILIETDGRQRLQMVRLVFGTEALTALFGPTADLPADQNAAARDKKLEASLERPLAHIDQGRVAPSANSPYAVELLVKQGDAYVPRPAVSQEGLAFVKISRGELYAVRLVNRSSLDAAVDLKIDGLSVFAFSDNKTYRHFIVPAGESATILGWHRTNAFSDAFQVMEYSKSEAGKRLATSSDDGTITATFCAAWPEGAAPPKDEPVTDGSRSVDATGRGASVAASLQELRRHVGGPRAVISVRYSEKIAPADLPADALSNAKTPKSNPLDAEKR